MRAVACLARATCTIVLRQFVLVVVRDVTTAPRTMEESLSRLKFPVLNSSTCAAGMVILDVGQSRANHVLWPPGNTRESVGRAGAASRPL